MADVVTIVDGVSTSLGEIAGVSDLQWSHGWPYGCLQASWRMDLKPNTFPRALTPNAQVEIWDGPIRVWAGYLSEPVPGSPWELHATGWYAAFSSLLALDATPAPTAIPSVAVAQAITRASLPVTVGSTLQSTTISSADETVATNYVLALMDTYAAQSGQRWAVDADRVLTVAADPPDVFYVLDSMEALRGTADDDYVTDVYSRYVSSVDGVTGDPDGWGLGHVGVSSPPAGRRERAMDVTDLGLMTSATADGYAQGQLDLNSARMGYTNGLTVARGEMLRPGGAPVRLAQVKAGRLLRSFNVADASGQVQVGATADVVIGRTQYVDGEQTIQIEPVGLAPRTFVDTLRVLRQSDEFDGAAV